MKTSTTWSSSRMATRVSWSPEEMIISLFMGTPVSVPPRAPRAGAHVGVPAASAAASQTVNVSHEW